MRRAAALLACALAGCASEPPRIPEGLQRMHAAVVRAWSPAEGEIRVIAIDATEIGGSVTHAYVASGEHRVTVRWSSPKAVTRVGQVHAVLQAGSSYVVEAEPDAALRTVRFSLVDKGPGYDEECLKPTFFGGTVRGRAC